MKLALQRRSIDKKTDVHKAWGDFFIGITFLLLFLLQPFFTLLFCVIFSLFMRTKNPFHVYMVVFLGSLYLGLVNITKTPESDLIQYLAAFDDAKIMNLGSFFILYSREPLYYLAVYVMGSIDFLDGRHFILASTFIQYFVYLVAVLKLCLHINLSHRSTVAFIVMLLFFPSLFSISAHLMRQFIASSICIYVVVQMLIFEKTNILLAFVSFLNHFFVGLFFFLIVSLKIAHSKRISKALVLISSSLTLALVGVALYSVSRYLVDMPYVGAIFSRIINPVGFIEFAPFNLSQTVFSLFILGCSLFNLNSKWSSCKTANFEIIHWATVFFCGIVILSSFISSFSEVTLRFSLFLYFAVGFVFPYTLFRINRRIDTQPFLIILMVLVIISFMNKIQFGAWEYADIVELLSYSFFGFWAL